MFCAVVRSRFRTHPLLHSTLSHVVKFLRRGDPKYKSFFVRRMQQLASGDRSRILQKRLKGSQTTIYECKCSTLIIQIPSPQLNTDPTKPAYLEQKSGFRILWTEEGDNIVVWFVAKHKEVSRLTALIDDSKSRTARQHLPESIVTQLQSDDLLPQAKPQGVLLDVLGNVPLKLYDVKLHGISDIEMDSWTPNLHLTEEERSVVEAEGTVLVLGRSGTGKVSELYATLHSRMTTTLNQYQPLVVLQQTVCVCNRMEYDRQKHCRDLTFSQLFVARSKRLCKYVSETVGINDQSTFQTFEEVVQEIDAALPPVEGDNKCFLPSQRVDFWRYKQEFHNTGTSQTKEASALVVWTGGLMFQYTFLLLLPPFLMHALSKSSVRSSRDRSRPFRVLVENCPGMTSSQSTSWARSDAGCPQIYATMFMTSL